MIDNVRAVKPHADILLLPYCNSDLLKPHSFWDSTITLLCLTLLIESSTRITPTTATLTDHIIQTTQMHSQRLVYLTWASVTIAPSPVQNLFNFQNVNSKPILSLRSFKHFKCCMHILAWLVVVWHETFLFCLIVCVYTFFCRFLYGALCPRSCYISCAVEMSFIIIIIIHKTAFCSDLNCAPFIWVPNYTDPEEALSIRCTSV